MIIRKITTTPNHKLIYEAITSGKSVAAVQEEIKSTSVQDQEKSKAKALAGKNKVAVATARNKKSPARALIFEVIFFNFKPLF